MCVCVLVYGHVCVYVNVLLLCVQAGENMCRHYDCVRFIIMTAYEIISKFTFQLSVGSAGERERRAWSVNRGTLIVDR